MVIGVHNICTGKTTFMDVPITIEQFLKVVREPKKAKEILPHLTPVELEFLHTGKTREQQNEDYEKI